MRVIVIVLDGVGIGALPDAALYNDAGANTLVNCAQAAGGLYLPNLERLGLGNIAQIQGVKKVPHALAAFGKMAEASVGKDTITGHWEIAGLKLTQSFPLYPDGFPPQIIEAFTQAVGKKGVLWNKTASGTDIIRDWGEEHFKTGLPIVYTSADSVFQIAAHIEVTPLDELYAMCRAARNILTGEYRIGRVIARPFGGFPGAFERVPGRMDFAVPPPEPTLLDKLQAAGHVTVGIGKIGDIFANTGLTQIIHTNDNREGIEQTLAALDGFSADFIFTNLVDLDTLYGHRNDVAGFAQALSDFDQGLGRILAALEREDILVITADHGCDPTTPGTDHTREHVPLLVFGGMIIGGVNLGTRQTYSDLGQTIAEAFKIDKLPNGESFWPQISKGYQGVQSWF
ncbi:MAG: phosphopentomutase [Candidatus Schekmanbacteria bacterium]|nr:phosphopentomutase [Candidatus Schekmanbacteria bacterium]